MKETLKHDDFLKETAVLDTLVRNTDHVARLRGKKSATYSCKIHCLCQKKVLKKTLAGS